MNAVSGPRTNFARVRAGGPVPVIPETSAPWALIVSGSVLAAGIVLFRMRRTLPAGLAVR